MVSKTINHDIQNQVILFTKYPEPRKVKTRLIPRITAQQAALLHQKMTENMIGILHNLKKQYPVNISIYYTGTTQQNMRSWLGKTIPLYQQVEGTLGDKLKQAFLHSFHQNYNSTLIIGTDCPTLTIKHLEQAFLMLKKKPLVIGPSEDGGYYLIGLSKMIPQIFEGISWSTYQVLQQTIQKAKDHNLTYQTLETLTDIDTPSDLIKYIHLFPFLNMDQK